MPRLESPAVTNIPHLFQPNSACLPVIDPMLKHFGRVWINMRHVEHTGAVRRWICRDSHQPSLCMLFQRGRCTAGPNCNQAHISVDHINAVRELLLSQPYTNCCYRHGELASRRDAFRTMLRRRMVQVKYGADRVVTIPPECIAVTAFWDRHIKADRHSTDLTDVERLFRFPWQRVCRLHQMDCCRYGVDCNNVHLCREFCLVQQLGPDPEEMEGDTDTATLLDDLTGLPLLGYSDASPTSVAGSSMGPTTPTSPHTAATCLLLDVGHEAPPSASRATPPDAVPRRDSWLDCPPSTETPSGPLVMEPGEALDLMGTHLQELLSCWPAHAPVLRCAAVAVGEGAGRPQQPAPLLLVQPFPTASSPAFSPLPTQPPRQRSLPPPLQIPQQRPTGPTPTSAAPAAPRLPPSLAQLEAQLIREALAAHHMKDIVELGFGRWLVASSQLVPADPPSPPPVCG